MTLLLCIFVMAVPIHTYLNVGILLLQIAFAGTILAVSLSLQHARAMTRDPRTTHRLFSS
jgi:hypothetical protein